jgi:hypothetical protein
MWDYYVGSAELVKESICDELSSFKQAAQDPNW